MVRANKCELCHEEKYTLAHHSDYTKPLEITWLCDSCHVLLHAKQKASRINGKKGGKRSKKHKPVTIPYQTETQPATMQERNT